MDPQEISLRWEPYHLDTFLLEQTAKRIAVFGVTVEDEVAFAPHRPTRGDFRGCRHDE